jgi:para-aminobenzoate synthetase/4-amino-4-deoxychorismate lyase
MRYDEERIALLDRHVARLARSADYFAFPFSEEQFRQRLAAVTASLGGESPHKVRATLDRRGRIEVTTAALGPRSDAAWRLTVAEERVDRTDPLFYHKTTRRGTYRRAREAAQEAGYDEAVLLNREGEVTEGTYTNLFVRQGESLYTPPIESGLLAGVYRDFVLDTQPEASTRPLTVDDLRSADALYCCNAVRGWCEAVLEAHSVPPAKS